MKRFGWLVISLAAWMGSCGDPTEPGTVQQMSCIPLSCYGAGATCGTISDGCGGKLNCGTCPSGQVCNNNNCYPANCVPYTCAQVGANCGCTGDGCGGTICCGTCPTGYHCNSIVCVQNCIPGTCQSFGYNCGTAPDGCGGSLSCGKCNKGQVCCRNKCHTGTTCY
jgi:hypothetical protein